MEKKIAQIINMTPHDVVLVGSNGNQIRIFERSGQTIRCKATTETIGNLDGIPVSTTVYGALTVVDADGTETELPEAEAETYYIVSSLVAQAAKRPDFLIPNESVRDEAGRIVGCKSLGVV